MPKPLKVFRIPSFVNETQFPAKNPNPTLNRTNVNHKIFSKFNLNSNSLSLLKA